MSSSRDLGANQYAENTVDTSSRLYAGTVTVGTADAEPLNDGESQTVTEVLVQAEPGNDGYLTVGTETAQVIVMAPGQVMVLPITDVSKVYVKARSGSQIAHWIARGG